MTLQRGGKDLVCLFAVESAVLAEKDHVGGVYEVVAEITRKYLPVQILPAACRIVASGLVYQRAFYLRIVALKGHVKSEVGDYAVIALLYPVEYHIDILSPRCLFVAGIKKVCHLCIVAEALSGSGGDDIPPLGIGCDYIAHLAELLAACKGASAEFNCFDVFAVQLLSPVGARGKSAFPLFHNILL